MVKPQKLREFAAYYLSAFPEQARKDGIFLTAEEIRSLPANKQKIGDVLIVTVPDGLAHKKQDIGKLLLRADPKARLVLNDFGISGPLRIPNREIIACREESASPASAETIHKENGCRFKLDASKIMFSKGNLAEKKILANQCDGEVVADMFAGIGYFSIPIAVHSAPQKIIAVELNPLSYGYLCENIRLNGAEKVIEPICGDCQNCTPPGIADRVLMGYVGTTHYYLETGIRAVQKNGGYLHYHETVHERDFPARAVERLIKAAEKCGREAVILETRKVKKYAPGVYHIVIDAEII